VAFWLSRLGVALNRSDGTRVNNPQEFERIVARHRAHFFYLDPRLLEQ
jgi:hypothetical protein